VRENGKFNIHSVKFNFIYLLAASKSCHEAFETVLKGISQRNARTAKDGSQKVAYPVVPG
jgi:hypothetical protein